MGETWTRKDFIKDGKRQWGKDAWSKEEWVAWADEQVALQYKVSPEESGNKEEEEEEAAAPKAAPAAKVDDETRERGFAYVFEWPLKKVVGMTLRRVHEQHPGYLEWIVGMVRALPPPTLGANARHSHRVARRSACTRTSQSFGRPWWRPASSTSGPRTTAPPRRR